MAHGSQKTENADRFKGGPGSSHQNADKPETHQPRERGRDEQHGVATNGPQSGKGSGGGERDSHHTHDPKLK